MDNASYLDTLAEVYLKLGDKTNAKKFNDMAKKFAEKKDTELLKGILEREKLIPLRGCVKTLPCFGLAQWKRRHENIGLALSQAQFEMRFLGIKLNSTSVPSLRVMV